MAPKSQTWSGRDSRLQPSEPDNRRSSSFVRMFYLPAEVKNITHGIVHKVYQPIGTLFRRKSSRKSSPASQPAAESVRTQSCRCSEVLEDETVPPPGTGTEVDAGGNDMGARDSIEGTGPWPPIVRSTEAPLTRYHSFPEPRFSGETRRRSWVFAVVRTARQKVVGMFPQGALGGEGEERNLLRRRPMAKRERERSLVGMVVRVETRIERESEGPPRLPELELMVGNGVGDAGAGGFGGRDT